MKTVIMMAMISVISYHASAQEVVSTDAVKIGTAVTRPAAVKSTAGKKSVTAKSKKSLAVKAKPANIAEEESTTLISESSHKAKSTFQQMLEKRIKIDAQKTDEDLVSVEREKRKQ